MEMPKLPMDAAEENNAARPITMIDDTACTASPPSN